jgi:hypothetical protein
MEQQPLSRIDNVDECGAGQCVPFSDLTGHTLVSVEGACKGSDAILLVALTGRWWIQYEPDCCASCDIDDIVGDLNDLIGHEILEAREDSSSNCSLDGEPNADVYDSCTWTFYNIQTTRGHVQLRWFGSSNGYYSESTTLYRLTKDPR